MPSRPPALCFCKTLKITYYAPSVGFPPLTHPFPRRLRFEHSGTFGHLGPFRDVNTNVVLMLGFCVPKTATVWCQTSEEECRSSASKSSKCHSSPHTFCLLAFFVFLCCFSQSVCVGLGMFFAPMYMILKGSTQMVKNGVWAWSVCKVCFGSLARTASV
jgi:hypothetical protein